MYATSLRLDNNIDADVGARVCEASTQWFISDESSLMTSAVRTSPWLISNKITLERNYTYVTTTALIR